MSSVTRGPLVSAGLLLGMGLGGFVDGIVFHQILQTHNMLSARHPPDDLVAMKLNMLWDGMFHAATWLITVVGLFLLFRAGARRDVPWSGRTLVGAMLAGWGLFNLAEGAIDHHWLHVHHVVERLGLSVWDWAFLGSGAFLLVIGVVLVWSGRHDAYEARRLA
jgi:uncharacterized membrane protein